VWHLLTLGAMVTCGWLAAWQWQRAGSAMGSALNVGYGLQWPVFAVFFGVMWWRMLRMEAAKLEETASAAPPAEDAAPLPAQRDGEPRPAPAPDAPSPFGPRPHDAASPPVDDPELVAYNQMLAQLAARHPDR
jgi:DNA-binding transcriptional regulator of glucitol operon